MSLTQTLTISFYHLQSSKSKAAKLSKQAKVFTTKSAKSNRRKSGKADKSGKGGKTLFRNSSEGYDWWSSSAGVSYQNSGSDYTPIGLENKSSALDTYGLVSWTVMVSVVGCVGSLL